MTPRPDFIRRSRNPSLPPPPRFEPTIKRPGDIEILSEHEMRRREGR
jgi:hypothetical protein